MCHRLTKRFLAHEEQAIALICDLKWIPSAPRNQGHVTRELAARHNDLRKQWKWWEFETRDEHYRTRPKQWSSDFRLAYNNAKIAQARLEFQMDLITCLDHILFKLPSVKTILDVAERHLSAESPDLEEIQSIMQAANHHLIQLISQVKHLNHLSLKSEFVTAEGLELSKSIDSAKNEMASLEEAYKSAREAAFIIGVPVQSLLRS